jgi:hypothetical protein
MKSIPSTTLAILCAVLLLLNAGAPVGAEGGTYLIKLGSGAEIICDKMVVEGDTVFYMFSSFGRKRVGINKDAIKAIFVRKKGHGDESPSWEKTNILSRVLDPSQGPWN